MPNAVPVWADKLLESAALISRNAYVPYSDFPVGAAVLTEDGSIFPGVNVENASFGLTVCAERNAIALAVASGYPQIKAIAVWAERTPNHSVQPCGACRQVIAEFMPPEGRVIFIDEQTGQAAVRTMAQLLPQAFEFQADLCRDSSEPPRPLS